MKDPLRHHLLVCLLTELTELLERHDRLNSEPAGFTFGGAARDSATSGKRCGTEATSSSSSAP